MCHSCYWHCCKKAEWKHENLIQFNASHVPKWSERSPFFSMPEIHYNRNGKSCLHLARNYGFLRFAFFKWTHFLFFHAKINRDRWSKAVSSTSIANSDIIVLKSRVSVAKNQFEHFDWVIYALTFHRIALLYTLAPILCCSVCWFARAGNFFSSVQANDLVPSNAYQIFATDEHIWEPFQ